MLPCCSLLSNFQYCFDSMAGPILRKVKCLGFFLIIAYVLLSFVFKREELDYDSNAELFNATMSPDVFSEEVQLRLDEQKVTKLIILAVNPRSGSSYIADILSSPPLSSLWQEPLRFLYEKPPMDDVLSHGRR